MLVEHNIDSKLQIQAMSDLRFTIIQRHLQSYNVYCTVELRRTVLR